MRLTAELITKSHSYLNPLKERELDLRGHKIPTIENLGVTKGDQECIDLTDNDISTLGNFPLSPRLQSLLVARNRISSIQASMPKNVPNLHTVNLAQNKLTELSDLEPLRGFAKLLHLSLVGNPVAGKEHYRYWVIWLCPQIRFLDFQKVKDAERSKAKELLGTSEAPTDLAQSILSVRSHQSTAFSTTNAASTGDKLSLMKITESERKKLQVLIKNAKTLQEVQRLEKAFNEGRLPSSVMDEAMDET